MTKMLVGLFNDFTAALNTATDLVSVGVRQEDISVVANDTKGELTNFRPVAESTATVASAGAGAAIGGVGGLLLGLGTLAIPGIGPIIAAGPLVATLAGATLGAATDGLIGAFKDLGVPETEARSYVESIRRGGTVLTVTVADELVDEVSEIIRRHKAVNIDERVAQWQQSDRTNNPTSSSTPETITGQTIRSSLDIDDGRVILKKQRPEALSPAPTLATPATRKEQVAEPVPVDTPAASVIRADDTTIIKVNSRYSPRGKHGQKYLASGVKLSIRLWENEQPGKSKSPTQRDYETVGYVIKGRAELQTQGQTIILEPGNSWIVAKVSVVVDNYGIHKAKAVERWLAAHPRFELLFLPTYCPKANPIERAFGDVHDKCTRNHQRKRIADLVWDVERHLLTNGPWQYKLSQLYYTPKVTAAVERLTTDQQLQQAA